MVRIRMQRFGRTHRPFYRINAIEKRNPRNGKIIENLGWYNPCEKDESKQVFLKEERIRHWLSVGAQPSNTVANLLGEAGLMDKDKLAAAHAKRIAPKVKAMEAAKKAEEERLVAEKAAAEAEAKAKAEDEAKAAAEAEAAADAAGDEGESKDEGAE
ncbi:MAG: 30S ribosomal protein S16 [Phycisphaerales bacterium JB043]